MVTPSVVMVGAPRFLSRTTLRPFGPSVMATASASLSTPASSARRASSSNFRIFAAIEPPRPSLLPDDGEDVASRQDQVLLALHLHLGAAVLREDHPVARLDVPRDR